MTKQKQNNLSAVVGELVAEMRARAEDDRKHGEPDQLLEMWIETLSALLNERSEVTAEAGKGEVERLLDATEALMRECVKQIKCWNFPQYDEAHRACKAVRESIALSTATPAGEWVEDAIDALEKAQVALRLSNVDGSAWTDRESPLYEIGLVLAASPRGASAG